MKFEDGRVLFKDVNLHLAEGAKVGVIGPNGAGKSTLLKIVAGKEKRYDGEAYASRDVRIGYLEQEPQLDPRLSVYENVYQGLGYQKQLLDEFNDISLKFANPDADFDALLERQSELQTIIEDQQLWDLSYKVKAAMECLKCPPADAAVDKLSGGERRRVALSRLLLSSPDLVILDEPTNHIDAESVAWLEQFLTEYKGGVLAVTHDRYFLDNIAKQIYEVDNNDVHVHQGNYSSWLERKTQRMERSKRKNTIMLKQLNRELTKLRKAGSSAVTGQKSRKAAYEELQEEYNKSTSIDKVASGQLIIPCGERLGDKVIECTKISKSFDGRTLFKDLSFTIGPGEIWGIIGQNGCGKSTLFKVIQGLIEPDSGTVEHGDTVEMGWADQSRLFESEENGVFEEIAGDTRTVRLGKREFSIRNYVAQFNFSGNAQSKPMRLLSGGERNRVHLAKLLKHGHNVLGFDEPTNDLDIQTLRSLEDALLSFPGTAIVISHDRWFLDNICTNIIAFEPNGEVNVFQGNLGAYLESPGHIRVNKSKNASKAKVAATL